MAIQPPMVAAQDPAVVTAWYDCFLTLFPEFSPAGVNGALYPQTLIEAWLPFAVEEFSPQWFGKDHVLAVCLLVAHQAALNARNQQLADSPNAIVGQNGGALTSKSIEKLSVSYGQITAAYASDAGVLNLTSYGLQLQRLLDMHRNRPFYLPGRVQARRW